MENSVLFFSANIHRANEEERADKIMCLIDLTQIKELESRPANVIFQLHLIKQILL